MVERPLILVANDDGIDAPGLWHLAEAMLALGEVMVVAPAFQSSGSGTAVTIYRNLQSEKVRSPVEGVAAWQVDGTATDAVIIGLRQHAPRHVDMIVSGVNPGANLGADVIHSGTVGAAMQGHHRGMPSLAVSLASEEPMHLRDAAQVGARVAEMLLASGRPLFLNVNVPARPLAELNEIRVTALASRGIERLLQEVTPRGMIQRRLEYVQQVDAAEGTDISTDLTAFHALDEARAIFLPGSRRRRSRPSDVGRAGA